MRRPVCMGYAMGMQISLSSPEERSSDLDSSHDLCSVAGAAKLPDSSTFRKKKSHAPIFINLAFKRPPPPPPARATPLSEQR